MKCILVSLMVLSATFPAAVRAQVIIQCVETDASVRQLIDGMVVARKPDQWSVEFPSEAGITDGPATLHFKGANSRNVEVKVNGREVRWDYQVTTTDFSTDFSANLNRVTGAATMVSFARSKFFPPMLRRFYYECATARRRF